jgi:hypothetical protein
MEFFAIRTYPKTVRIAFYSLVVGWAVFLWSVYHYFAPEYLGRFAIAGVLVIFFMLRLKNWARMLCLCTNAMVILYFSFFGLLFATKQTPDIIAAFFSALCVLLFLISSFFLLVKPTREFYKLANPPGTDPFPSESVPREKNK